MATNITYGDVVCQEYKSKNWKRMHGIPLKTKGITDFGGIVVHIDCFNKYISPRSKKKRKKHHFRRTLNPIVESFFEDKPDAKCIYHRYGYMKKKCKRKLRELERKSRLVG